MNTEKLLVHKCSQWQTVEGLHARVVHALRVLDFALLLEREVLREVSALVVAPQQEQRRRVHQL